MLGRTGGKGMDVFEDAFHKPMHVNMSTPRDRRVKALVFEKVALRVMGLGDTVGEKQKPVAGI